MVPDSTQSVVDDERLRLVARYFSAAPPPSLPVLPGLAFLVGSALIVSAFFTTGLFFVLLMTSGAVFTYRAAFIYQGWKRLSSYMTYRKSTDDKMDEFFKDDLASIESEAAYRFDQYTRAELVVAIDLTDADRTDGICPPRARIGDDGQLRAERYSVCVLFLHPSTVTICTCNLDFRTGEAIFGAGDTIHYENLELNVDRVKLRQPLIKMIDPVYENEIPVDISKERIVRVLTLSGRVLPVKLGHYSNDRESMSIEVAWPNNIAVRKLLRKLHT